MVTYETFPPPPHLEPFLRFFWVLEYDEPGYLHRGLADPCAELVVHYQGLFDELLPGGGMQSSYVTGLNGPTRQVRLFRTEERFGIFGAYFYPHALPALFGVPAQAVFDQMPDLYEAMGPEGRWLEERLLAAGGNAERMSVLADFLTARLHKARTPDAMTVQAMRHILANPGHVRMRDLANRYYLSERQFERRFVAEVGMRPKLFARIARFHAAMSRPVSDFGGLARLAVECGYYDQSHFIHEVKEFSGLHPHEFFGGSGDGLGWMEG